MKQWRISYLVGMMFILRISYSLMFKSFSTRSLQARLWRKLVVVTIYVNQTYWRLLFIMGMIFYKVKVLDQLCILFFHENRVISMHLVYVMELYVVLFYWWNERMRSYFYICKTFLSTCTWWESWWIYKGVGVLMVER